MFHFFVGFIHIAVSFLLIFIVLIQNNKGMGLSGAFGSAGASESVFGSSGGLNVLVKITIVLSVIFAITSLSLSFVPPSTPNGGIMAEEANQGVGGSLSELVGGGAQDGAGQAPAGAEQAPGGVEQPVQAPGEGGPLEQPLPDTGATGN